MWNAVMQLQSRARNINMHLAEPPSLSMWGSQGTAAETDWQFLVVSSYFSGQKVHQCEHTIQAFSLVFLGFPALMGYLLMNNLIS